MKYACFYHETYIQLLLGIDTLHSLLNFYFAFSLLIFAISLHNLRLVKAQIKTFPKADNQGITGYFKSPPAPKRSPRHPIFISKFKFP